jgi:hypothetical protein
MSGNRYLIFHEEDDPETNYIADTLETPYIVYEITDFLETSELTDPIGSYDPDIGQIDQLEDYNSEYIMEAHQNIRKIDPEKVTTEVNKALMAAGLPTKDINIEEGQEAELGDEQYYEDPDDVEPEAQSTEPEAQSTEPVPVPTVENEAVVETHPLLETQDPPKVDHPVVEVLNNAESTLLTIALQKPDALPIMEPAIIANALPEAIAVEPEPEPLPEFEPEYTEAEDDDDFDFSDLAVTTLSTWQKEKLENIDVTKTVTGEIVVKKVKKAYEVIYPSDVLHQELLSDLQDQNVAASIADELATSFLNITELTNDQIQSANNPIEKFKYLNPIIYNYLRNFRATSANNPDQSSNLPKYYKYWLIPIVSDIKKVYDSTIASDERDAILSTEFGDKLSLIDEIKRENKLFSRINSKTDHDINNAYNQSSSAYHPKASTEELISNSTQFNNIDFDRQDYTIHVLRYGSIGSDYGLQVRKADSAVYKVKNKYEHLKKLTSKITGLEHYLSVDGEVVNMVGFLRLPIEVTNQSYLGPAKDPKPFRVQKPLWENINGKDKLNSVNSVDEVSKGHKQYQLQTALWEISTGKKKLKVYHDVAEIPDLTASNANDPVIVIFDPKSDYQKLEQTFLKTIPSIDTLVQIYSSQLNTIQSIDEVNQVLRAYDVQFKDLGEVAHNKIIQTLRSVTEGKVEKYTARGGRLQKLIESQTEINQKLLRKSLVVTDNLIMNDIIVKNYGKYPDLGRPVDSDENRLVWLEKQLDKGQLFYAVLHYELMAKYVSSDPNVAFSQLDFNNMEPQLNKIITNLKSQLDSAQSQLSQLEKLIASDELKSADLIKKGQAIKLSDKPLIVFLTPEGQASSIGQADADLKNVYILNGKTYVPQFLYSNIKRVQQLRLHTKALELKSLRVQNLTELVERANGLITQAVTRSKLLQAQHHKNSLRAQVQTSIKSQDLSAPDQSLLDLFKHIKNANSIKANTMYLKLIESSGMLSADGGWIISKTTGTKICCVHKKDLLLGYDLAKYADPKTNGMNCKICSEQIADPEFDVFGGYDGDDKPVITHEGNVIDNFNDEFVEPAQKAEVNCENYSNNYNQKYCCAVVQYLRDHSNTNRITLTKEQTEEAIDLYSVIIGISDLKTNVGADASNKFYINNYTNEVFIPAYKKMIGKSTVPPADKLATVVLASILISKEIDEYILALVSTVIVRELTRPQIYLLPYSKTTKLLIDQTVQVQLDKGTKEIPLYAQNLTSILLNSQSIINKTTLQFITKDSKIPVIGDRTSVKPSEYFEFKMKEYYTILRKYPDIKSQYFAAEQSVAQLEPVETIIVDPETLIKKYEVGPITESELSYSNANEYEKLIARIQNRLRYIDLYRPILFNQFSHAISDAITNTSGLVEKLARFEINKDCPTDLKQLYTDYLMSLPKITTSKASVPKYLERPALAKKSYNMSSQASLPTWLLPNNSKEPPLASMSAITTAIADQSADFSQLEVLDENGSVVALKDKILDLDEEIFQLNQRLKTLKSKTRFPQAKDGSLKPSSSTQMLEITLYNKNKAQKWKVLEEVEVDLSSKKIKSHPRILQILESKIPIGNRIEYLRTMLLHHLAYVKFGNNVFDEHKYVSLLTNLGQSVNKSNEINSNIENLKTRYNHTWDPKVIAYLFTHDQANQKQVIQRDAIKSYIYLLHYVVSVIRNDFAYPSDNDTTKTVGDLIDDVKSEIEEYNIFEKYKYVLSNSEVHSLVGVFSRPDGKSLDKTDYLSPSEAIRVLHYAFIEEMITGLKSIYGFPGDEVPSSTSQNGVKYCEFIIKFLDLVNDMNVVNDATTAEVSNMFTASLAKKYKKKDMSKEEQSLYNQMLKYKLKNYDEPQEMGSDLPNTDESQKLTKLEKLDQILNTAEDIPTNDFQGEQEDQNEDTFGDDITYD